MARCPAAAVPWHRPCFVCLRKSVTSWKCPKTAWIWHVRTRFNGEHGVLGQQVDSVILKFFPNHNGSVILQSKGWHHRPHYPCPLLDWSQSLVLCHHRCLGPSLPLGKPYPLITASGTIWFGPQSPQNDLPRGRAQV